MGGVGKTLITKNLDGRNIFCNKVAKLNIDGDALIF
jgi:hypothetical protein